MKGWSPFYFDGGFLIYTIMNYFEKELEIQIKKNNELKKLIELLKENEEMETHYSELWFNKQNKRVKELLEKRKERESLSN
jgi:hypothetical protein